ncbi:MAG TPA: IS200/IS605 family transposase [Syntrophaceae bacterium]|nr:IS200/IS605 family transposase [Syntrophaceae bacterium]
MVNINTDIWHWYHNVSECYYHIQIRVKYRKSLLSKKFEGVIIESIRGIKERYAIEVSHVGFDQNHIHMLVRFLPKYSGGQVIRLLKSISAKAVFREIPEVKAELWGGEFWTDGYYISTISGKGNKAVIEKYIQNQGREKDIEQLKLFEI